MRSSSGGDTRRELKKIAQAANKLRYTLQSANALTISRFGAAPGLAKLFWRSDPREASQGQRVAIWEREYSAGAAESEILRMLNGIAATAEAEEKELPRGDGQQAPYPESIPAQRELVRDCLRLFETYRPGKASTTEEGDFRLFVSLVWEIATGKKDIDMIRVIAPVIRAYRGDPT